MSEIKRFKQDPDSDSDPDSDPDSDSIIKHINDDLIANKQKLILENMIPFVLNGSDILCSKEPVKSIDHNFMYKFNEWDVNVGKRVSTTTSEYLVNKIVIIDGHQKLITEKERFLQCNYEINNRIYKEIFVRTKHPSGTFVFMAFLDEVYLQVPDYIQDLIKNNKIYVSTRMNFGSIYDEHIGTTRILIPVS
jgi:hypothetical protein